MHHNTPCCVTKRQLPHSNMSNDRPRFEGCPTKGSRPPHVKQSQGENTDEPQAALAQSAPKQIGSSLSQNRPIYKSTSTMAVRKRSHCHTWTHINSVVRRVPRQVSINDYNNQDRTGFNIHATYYIKFTDTFHHQSTNKSYYKPSLIE